MVHAYQVTVTCSRPHVDRRAHTLVFLTLDPTNSTTTETSTTENSTKEEVTGTSESAFVMDPIPHDDWDRIMRTAVFAGFWVVVALVIFVLIPGISIGLDRLYCRRNVNTYTVNRMDRIGVELQEASEVMLDEPEREATHLMLPESTASVCNPSPPSPTTPVEIDQHDSMFTHQATKPLENSYETTNKLAAESGESVIHQLTNMSDGELAWLDQNEDPPPSSLRDRSLSAGAAPATQIPTNLNQQYAKVAKPWRGEECLVDSPSNGGLASQPELPDVPASDGLEPSKDPCSVRFMIPEGDDQDAVKEASLCPEEWRNKSYLHSPSASSKAPIHIWKPPTKQVHETPSEKHFSHVHIYEELGDVTRKERPPGVRTSVSESDLVHSSGCKITFPQYFEVDDFTVTRTDSGGVHPLTLKSDKSTPQSPLPHSITLLTQEDDASSDEDINRRGNDSDQCVIKVRTQKGLMAHPLSAQHRLSDGALERAPSVIPHQFSSLQRHNVAPQASNQHVAAYYSKLNRFRPPHQALLPVSGNIYHKLIPTVDPHDHWEGTQGGDTSLMETSL
ncbi:uncharacterized protein LOC110985098 isoform X2 [Acanthaster planci]|uniref:Uncharacterized protein LOC110985098 isoform X2 n=1 Tax=Acanthaster planci TaxID=133434 RepID=A0A8B7Z9B7_ACAPL|nr:uncharacterized protein LOC110985098 isoform X2 [Acanthaster planci]